MEVQEALGKLAATRESREDEHVRFDLVYLNNLLDHAVRPPNAVVLLEVVAEELCRKRVERALIAALDQATLDRALLEVNDREVGRGDEGRELLCEAREVAFDVGANLEDLLGGEEGEERGWERLEFMGL